MSDQEQRITELENRLAFLEDTLDQLNTIVTGQARTIDTLNQTQTLLVERLRELNEWARPEIENAPPPHY